MENKKKFVEELGKILMMYSREKVLMLKYIKEDFRELIEITYMNGSSKYINITGDSCTAVMKDIYFALL